MNKRKLRDGIIITFCAVVICITIVIYSLFTTKQIFSESASHLEEIYEQVNTTFQQKVSDYRSLMKSWENYISNATGTASRYDEFKLFIKDQKEKWHFTDFYFVNVDEGSGENRQAIGKRSTGEIEELEFRREMDVLLGGNDVGVVGTRPDGENGRSRFVMLAVRFEQVRSYDGFDYFAIAIIFNAEDLQNLIDVKAFNDSGNCFVVLPDGSILLQSREDESGDNFLNELKANYTIKNSSVEDLSQIWSEGSSSEYKGTVIVKNRQNGQEYYLTYISVEFSDWVLIGLIPSNIVNRSMSLFSTITIIVMTVIFASIMVAVVWMLIASNKQRVKEKELEIKSRESLLDLLTENTNDIFMVFSPDDFKGQYISSNVNKVLGLDYEMLKENVGRIGEAIVTDNSSEGLFEKIEGLKSTQSDLQLKNVSTDEKYWYRMVINPAEYNGKNSYLMMLSDHTKDRKLTADLKEALELAKSANEAKSNFLANMSHDIRTPMNAIIGFSTLLEKDAENVEKVREYNRKIAFSGQHLLSLINDVLDMSKIESGKTSLNYEEFDFSDFLEELYEMVAPQAKAKKQKFELHTKGNLPEIVCGDKLRINQILINLLSNSIKYTQEGGNICLSVEVIKNSTRNHVHLRFGVKDNGIGMSEDFIKILFEPFSRENTAKTKEIQGTGLGMAITKNIVDIMGGTISVSSQLEKGSEFIVELELSKTDNNIQDEELWEKHKINKILVVDDEKDVLEDVKLLMTEAGVETEIADSGSRAVEMVESYEKSGRGFDMILLDWKMPEMDGIETAKIIKANFTNIPIVIMSSYDKSEIEEEAKKADIKFFLSKPFFVSNLRNLVVKMCNEEFEEDKEQAKLISLEGMKILVAEDNEINAEILQELLDIEGATCDIANDGKAVLEKFKASKVGQYDFIFMDIQMPIMNGYEATRAIRDCSHPEAKSIPIIAMTANAFDDDVKMALDCGMNAHLAKPIDMDKLKQIIDKIRGEKNE